MSTTTSDRRTFLKQAAMAAATATVTGGKSAYSLPVLSNGDGNGSPIQWDKAPCRFCGTGCHVQVGVENGKIVAIAGDQQADVNKGLL